MYKKLTRGFTLIELLVVIAIIGILASVVLASLSGAREKAQIAAYKSQVSSMQKAVMLECDSNAGLTANAAGLAIVTGLLPVAASNKITLVGVTAASCGVQGAGTYTVTMNSIEIGSGTAAQLCETAGGTSVTQNGVTFPTGC